MDPSLIVTKNPVKNGQNVKNIETYEKLLKFHRFPLKFRNRPNQCLPPIKFIKQDVSPQPITKSVYHTYHYLMHQSVLGHQEISHSPQSMITISLLLSWRRMELIIKCYSSKALGVIKYHPALLLDRSYQNPSIYGRFIWLVQSDCHILFKCSY